MSAYFALVIVAALIAGTPWREREPWRVAAASVALVVAASSRNAAWVFASFEAFHWAAPPRAGGSAFLSVLGLSGLAILMLAEGSADPARLGSTPLAALGMALVVVVLAARWSLAGAADGGFFLPAGIALVAFVARLSIFAPELSTPIAGVAGAAFLLLGGVFAAWSETTETFVKGLAASTVGFAAVALSSGPRALPDVLLHVGVATLALGLVRVARTPLGVGIATASLASIPPFPGFLSKLPLLSELGNGLLAVALLGLVLAGIGCAREMERGNQAGRSGYALSMVGTATAIAGTVGVLVFADRIHALLLRAASAL